MCENAVQAVARDTLTHYMVNAYDDGVDLVAHIHDELMAQAPSEYAEEIKQKLIKHFGNQPAWADGLPCECEAKEAE